MQKGDAGVCREQAVLPQSQIAQPEEHSLSVQEGAATEWCLFATAPSLSAPGSCWGRAELASLLQHPLAAWSPAGHCTPKVAQMPGHLESCRGATVEAENCSALVPRRKGRLWEATGTGGRAG